MPVTFCKFVFAEDVSKKSVEDALDCAVFLAEFAFGKTRARIDAAYKVADEPPRCLIDVSTEVGRYIAVEVSDTFTKLRGDRSFEIYQVDQWKL
jgi:hypothetical protein